MNTSVARRRAFSPEFAERVTVNRTSLEMSSELSYDEWVILGQQLTEVGDSMAWWVGDWIRGGEKVYGSTYKQALEATPLTYETLMNYTSVARAFAEISRRRENLSFTHHAVVAALPADAADAWLNLAETNEWSVREMRERMRAEVQRDLVEPTITLAQLKLTVPHDTAERWKRAADGAGLSFEEWCAKTLDAAAA